MSLRTVGLAAAAAAALTGLAGGAASAQDGSTFQPVSLARMAVKLPVGQAYATIRQGVFCTPKAVVIWNGGQANLKLGPLQDAFRTEMTKAGYKVAGDGENLFDQTSDASGDFQLAGLVTSEDIYVCRPPDNRGRGHMSMGIHWELYSRLQGRVVATVDTTGKAEITTPSAGVLPELNAQSFAANVTELATSAELRGALANAAPGQGDLVQVPGQTPIVYDAPQGPPLPIDQAAASVVVVYSGVGQGSGVLISAGGYVLTDAHVVGDAKTVRLKWSDGLQSIGEVVRVAKTRDVALIKTDGRGRAPVPIRRTAVVPGETVFAVGTPLADKFQGTVTRGVVSGVRIYDGFSYIQSDVMVTHGSSGGPLLDDKGRLVGLTVQGLALGGIVPTGINLFTPIRDAADFLGLQAR